MTSPKPPWLADLPHTWKSANLGHVARVGTGSADVQDSDDNGAYPFVVRSPRLLRLETYTHDTEAVLTAGDGNVGEIFHHLKGKFAAHQRVYVIEPGPELHGRYLYYAMRGTFLNSLQGNTAKSTVESLRRPMLTGFIIPVPIFEHQKRIADYLDHETAEIDALTTDLTRLLEGIHERFAAYREPLVAPTADSPQTQLRHALLGLRDGSHGTHSRVGPEGVPLLSAKNVSSGHLLLTANESRISDTEALELTKSGFPREGDILLTVVGTIGRAAIYPRGPIFPFQRSVAFLRPNQKLLLPSFLLQLIRSQFFQDQLKTRSKTSAQPGVYLRDVGSCLIHLPSTRDQERTARALENAEKRIFEVSDQINNAIALARERRAALITAAVTGQIDVTARNKPAAEQLEDDIAQGLHREN